MDVYSFYNPPSPSSQALHELIDSLDSPSVAPPPVSLPRSSAVTLNASTPPGVQPCPKVSEFSRDHKNKKQKPTRGTLACPRTWEGSVDSPTLLQNDEHDDSYSVGSCAMIYESPDCFMTSSDTVSLPSIDDATIDMDGGCINPNAYTHERSYLRNIVHAQFRIEPTTSVQCTTRCDVLERTS
ncbi:hypothetical protein HMI56_005524 [Coelomomyces lativittatus]|nr:hypothetical protein HMI56_005524 [Coelomomyces lativittatus]